MSKKLLPFTVKQAPDLARPISEQHSRMIVSIGGERFAVDFSGILTELDPEKAQVVAIDQPKRKSSRRSP